MDKPETLEELYKRKFNWISDNFKNEIGHFNVFLLEPVLPGKAKPVPYKRRDFYKILPVLGYIDMHYADRVVPINGQPPIFSNPLIPFESDQLDQITGGFYCLFTH